MDRSWRPNNFMFSTRNHHVSASVFSRRKIGNVITLRNDEDRINNHVSQIPCFVECPNSGRSQVFVSLQTKYRDACSPAQRHREKKNRFCRDAPETCIFRGFLFHRSHEHWRNGGNHVNRENVTDAGQEVGWNFFLSVVRREYPHRFDDERTRVQCCASKHEKFE